jgi:hypothetical protein
MDLADGYHVSPRQAFGRASRLKSS